MMDGAQHEKCESRARLFIARVAWRHPAACVMMLWFEIIITYQLLFLATPEDISDWIEICDEVNRTPNIKPSHTPG